MSKSITVKAPAKINLGLAVQGRRADGYHELVSVMQQISLSDTLVLKPRPKEGWEFFCTDQTLGGEDNLVCQAAALLANESRLRLRGVRIILYKQIPTGAGLGGGSSDAAAALTALNRYWDLGLTIKNLKDIGVRLGSDVPFCLQGGTVLATGRGELLEPLPPLPHYWVVLALPRGMHLSTAAVYHGLDLRRVSVPPVALLADAIKKGDCAKIETWFRRKSVNTLEEAVVQYCAPVARLKHRFLELDLYPAMSGSGPSVFALSGTFKAAVSAARALQEEGNRAYLCWTVPV